jgi:hypothetical protein
MTDTTLTDLARQIADFMDLPAVLDLPALCSAHATYQDGAWNVNAQLEPDPATAWERVTAWAAVSGGRVASPRTWPSHSVPSGVGREVSATVRVAGLVVTVWGVVDALDPIPAQYVAVEGVSV